MLKRTPHCPNGTSDLGAAGNGTSGKGTQRPSKFFRNQGRRSFYGVTLACAFRATWVAPRDVARDDRPIVKSVTRKCAEFRRLHRACNSAPAKVVKPPKPSSF